MDTPDKRSAGIAACVLLLVQLLAKPANAVVEASEPAAAKLGVETKLPPSDAPACALQQRVRSSGTKISLCSSLHLLSGTQSRQLLSPFLFLIRRQALDISRYLRLAGVVQSHELWCWLKAVLTPLLVSALCVPSYDLKPCGCTLPLQQQRHRTRYRRLQA